LSKGACPNYSQRFLAIAGVFWPYSGEFYWRIKKFAQNLPQNGHKLDQRSPENMTHFRQKFAEHSSLFRRPKFADHDRRNRLFFSPENG
jgi:hypothetical protein